VSSRSFSSLWDIADILDIAEEPPWKLSEWRQRLLLIGFICGYSVSGVDLTLVPCKGHTTSLRTMAEEDADEGAAITFQKGRYRTGPYVGGGPQASGRNPSGILDTKTLSSRISDFFRAGA
jgi:hypothetical protein